MARTINERGPMGPIQIIFRESIKGSPFNRYYWAIRVKGVIMMCSAQHARRHESLRELKIRLELLQEACK